jgi:hypothetical protein
MNKNRYNKWRTAERIVLGVGTITLVLVMIGYSMILYFDILAQIINIIIN